MAPVLGLNVLYWNNQSHVLVVTESVDATRVTAVTVVRNGTPWVPFFVPAIFVPSVVP